MQIIFINPPFKTEYGRFSRESRSPAITKSGAIYYPLWLIYSAAYAEKKGHRVTLIDSPAKSFDVERTLSEVAKTAAGRVLFVLDTSTPSVYSDIDFGEKLKEVYPDSFIILVGTHPSALPEETLGISGKIDGVARKEFDLTVEELASTLEHSGDLKNVRGLTWRDGNEIISNADMPYLENLDDVPYAAEFIKKHLCEKDYFFAAATYPSIQIFTGRGCPFHCNFCVYPQVMHGHLFRKRSAENVVGEFQYIAENFPDVHEVVIEDDTFTADKKRVLEICRLLVERKINKRLRWLCNARVNLDYETMKSMRKAGCRLIIPGFETGSQTILYNIQKGTKVEQFLPYVKNAQKAGLLVHACFMVGNMGETKATMQETLELALKLNTDTAQFFPLIPYPGTKAYSWAEKNHYVVKNYADYCKEDGTHNTVLNLPALSAEEMVRFCDLARRKYYLRPRYILHRLWVGMRDPADLKRSLKAFSKLKNYLFK